MRTSDRRAPNGDGRPAHTLPTGILTATRSQWEVFRPVLATGMWARRFFRQLAYVMRECTLTQAHCNASIVRGTVGPAVSPRVHVCGCRTSALCPCATRRRSKHGAPEGPWLQLKWRALASAAARRSRPVGGSETPRPSPARGEQTKFSVLV